MHPTRARVTVVIATRNRCEALARTLRWLGELSPAPPVIVVDNGSDVGTAQAVHLIVPGSAVHLIVFFGAPALTARALDGRRQSHPAQREQRQHRQMR